MDVISLDSGTTSHKKKKKSSNHKSDNERYFPDSDPLFEAFRVQRYQLICAKIGRFGLTVNERDELECVDAWIAVYLEVQSADAATVRTAAANGWTLHEMPRQFRAAGRTNEYAEWSLDFRPTQAMPGTAEKIAIMEARIARGVAPCHPDDQPNTPSENDVMCANHRCKNGRDVERHAVGREKWAEIEESRRVERQLQLEAKRLEKEAKRGRQKKTA